MENLNKGTVIITTRRNKMEILRLKSMTESKISLERLNIRCEIWQRNNQWTGRQINIVSIWRTEKKSEQKLRDLWETSKYNEYIYNGEHHKVRRGEKRAEKVLGKKRPKISKIYLKKKIIGLKKLNTPYRAIAKEIYAQTHYK